MRILFFGDIMGRSGREALAAYLPGLRSEFQADAVIVNAENAAGGYGLSETLAQQFFEMGVDCLTTGNHVWDQKEMLICIGRQPRILRAVNFPAGTPGNGFVLLDVAGGKQIMVVHALGQRSMEPLLDDPFAAVDRLLAQHKLGGKIGAIFVDFHAEITSEKNAMAHYLDGRVSAVVGTHTHVPTADARVLRGGTAYQTDAGMCGDYDSVIGMNKQVAVRRFTQKMRGERLVPADGEGSVCGCMVETDAASGLALRIVPFMRGGSLGR